MGWRLVTQPWVSWPSAPLPYVEQPPETRQPFVAPPGGRATVHRNRFVSCRTFRSSSTIFCLGRAGFPWIRRVDGWPSQPTVRRSGQDPGSAEGARDGAELQLEVPADEFDR